MFGFIEVIRNKSISDKLQLPQSMKIHNVFHLNLFKKALIDLLTNQNNTSLLPVNINNEEK